MDASQQHMKCIKPTHNRKPSSSDLLGGRCTLGSNTLLNTIHNMDPSIWNTLPPASIAERILPPVNRRTQKYRKDTLRWNDHNYHK